LSEQTPPKVFISYSHKPDGNKERVLALSDRLRSEGVECWIDQYDPFPEEGWYLWMENQIENSQFVLVVCSENYMEGYKRKGGKGLAWETSIITSELFHKFSNNDKFIPVGFDKEDLEYIPSPITSASHFLISEEIEYKKLYSILTNQPITPASPLGSLVKIEPQPRATFSGSANSKVFNVPRRNPFFTGRESILKNIEESFESKNQTALTQTQAVHGLGGIGKTQIAVEFAYLHYKSYETILWVDAETNASFSKSVSDIAGQLDLPEKKSQEQEFVVQAVQRWLGSNKDWLLILDNIEDTELYDNFLPKIYEGDVLITTRRDDIENISKLAVDKMSEEEGILFLLNRSSASKQYQKIDDATDEDFTAAKTICQKFDGLPVALEQAGAYINSNRISLQKYLDMYEAEGAELSYADVFKWSLKKTEDDCPEAGELIRLCAFLDPDSIPKFIFEEGKEFLSDGLQKILESRFKWEELISKACRYSLLKRNNDDQTLSMHRLVQQVIKDSLDDLNKWLEKVVKILNLVFPDPRDLDNWPVCAQLFPSIGGIFKEAEKLGISEVGDLFFEIGIYLVDRGIYKEAEPYCKTAYKIGKAIHEEPHDTVLNFLNSLALLYNRQGRYDEAEVLHKEVLNGRKKIHGEEHPNVASSLNNLASLYYRQKRYVKAEPLYKDALKMKRKLLGKEHKSIGITLNDLALVYNNQERYDEAELFFKEALEMYKKLLGREHLEIATSLNNLALLYDNQGRYKEAEPLYKDALEMRKKLQGSEHPDVAMLLYNLGLFYAEQGKLKDGKAFLQQAMGIRIKLLGTGHPYTKNSIKALEWVRKQIEEGEGE
jgi:Tfp pilus assembly protein PilF